MRFIATAITELAIVLGFGFGAGLMVGATALFVARML
jgi:hypothetical protein